MRTIGSLLIATGIVLAQHSNAVASVDPETALKQLQAGNQRYRLGTLQHPHQSLSRRQALAKSQHPFVVVLSCADSRVPPDVVFDQGLGNVFTIRVAGNVATDDVIASIEYAVADLGPKLVAVLGHERCGAVDATLKGGEAEGHLAVLLDRIQPAVAAAQNEPKISPAILWTTPSASMCRTWWRS